MSAGALTSTRGLMAGVAIACGASVVFAWFAQHQWGMEPCPWCILQRILFIAIAVIAALGALLPWRGLRRAFAGVTLLLSAGGVAAALWQHFVAAKTQSCALTFADRVIGALELDQRWPDLFEVRASCADAAVDLLGVPFEFWSLALFALTGLVAIYVAFTRRA